MFSKRLLSITPYTPGEQPQNKKYIKLNTNENPYPPSPNVSTALKEFADNPQVLRLYPDPQSTTLRLAIANYYNINQESVFVGNGSDEVLAMSFFAFFDSNDGPLLFPSLTYSFYPVYCNFYNIDYLQVPLKEDFTISIDDYLNEEKSCGIIITNPNAPTGIALPLQEIKRLLDNYDKDRVVIIDEAYIDFGAESAVSLINQYKNLLIVQTFSKGHSLAGLRLGYAIADKELILALHTAKDSFNSYPADRIAQQLGAIAINDVEYFKRTTSSIIKTREWFSNTIKEMGYFVLPSSTNFVFLKHPTILAEVLYKKLKERGILVRWFSDPLICNFLRITIGLDSEMKELVSALKDIEDEQFRHS